MYRNRLYEARTNAHITQSDMASKLNMNITVYGRYERGERDIPLSLAAQVADVLNVTLDYIAYRSDYPLDEDSSIMKRTLLDPIINNPNDKISYLKSCINALREEQQLTNQKIDNAIEEIMKKVNEISPERK